VHERLRNPPLKVGPVAYDHAAVPPVGLEEVTMFALPSSATQEVVDGHETVCNPWVRPVTVVALQCAPPPAGSVEVNTDDGESPTATHSELAAHETLQKAWLSMFDTCQAAAPPAGFVDATTLPAWSTAMHSAVLAQDTDASWFRASTAVVVHAAEPPIGSVVVTTSPALSTATHIEIVGHDIPVRVIPEAPTCVSVQPPDPPVGSIEVITQLPSPATHSVCAIHDTGPNAVCGMEVKGSIVL
jgi:hypothetical protein